jgi:hypothetical protein
VHSFELLPPQSNFTLNRKPLLLLDFFQLVRFNHDLSIQLIDFRVNDFVRNGLNRPNLDAALVNV